MMNNIKSFCCNSWKKAKKYIIDYFQSIKFINLLNQALRLLILLLACFAFAIIIILISSKHPDVALQAFILGPFQDQDSLVQILDESLPLIFTGVAVCIMNKCGQCNMFVEGGFFVGAFVAGYVAPELHVPSFLIPIICLLLGGTISGLIGYIPAKMKASLNINEFVSSLMFNYIVFWIIMFLLDGPCADPDVANKTKYLEDNMKLFILDANTGLSIGIFIALGSAILGWLFLNKTIWGYRIRMTGDNSNFAQYSGINTKRSIVSSQVIGAFISGFGGATLMLGGSKYFRFEWKALPNYGFDGFVIAIMANNNPILVPIAALFLAYLRVGAIKMAVLSDVPNQVVYILQAAIIILFGAKIMIRFFKKRIKKNEVVKDGE